MAHGDGDHQQSEHPAQEPAVQPHVAVQHVAEFVGDDSLELVAVEARDGATRDGDRGVCGRIARGEGVDAVFVLEHVDLGHGHARSDGHFLDHVVQPTQRRIPGAALDAHTTQRTRHHRAAGAQRKAS